MIISIYIITINAKKELKNILDEDNHDDEREMEKDARIESEHEYNTQLNNEEIILQENREIWDIIPVKIKLSNLS